jgi:osmotically-inducible protein OsmY
MGNLEFHESERDDGASLDRIEQLADNQIRDDVQEMLASHSDMDMSGVEVRVRSGQVTLSGAVESLDAKLAAQVAAEQCSGVISVRNRLEVESDGAAHPEWRLKESEADEDERSQPDRGE